MKKIYRWGSLLLCLTFFVAGCTHTPPAGTQSAAPGESSGIFSADSGNSLVASSPAEPETESPEENSDNPVSPDIPTEDFFTQNGIAFLPDCSAVPGWCRKTATEHLYACDFTLPPICSEEFAGVALQTSGDKVVLTYLAEELIATVISVTSGEQLYTVSLPYNLCDCRLLKDGSLICTTVNYDDDSTSYFRYNSKGQPGEVYDLPGHSYLAVSSLDGRYIAYTDNEQSLKILDTSSNAPVIEKEHFGKGYLQISAINDGFYVGDSDHVIRFVAPERKEVTALYLPVFPLDSDGNLYVMYNEERIFSSGIENAPRCCLEVEDIYEDHLDFSYGYMMTGLFLDADYTFRFYDLRAQKITGELLFGEEGITGGTAVFLSDGRVAISVVENEEVKFYIYDLPSAVKEGSEGKDVEMVICTESELERMSAAIADEIYDHCGIEVLYGSRGNDFKIWDYVGVAELDPYRVYFKLRVVRSVLMKYPENMLREAYSETNRGLKMYLCGSIYGVSGNGGLTEASAVTTECDGYIVIALNVNNNLQYDIPHELSHAFDRRIAYVSQQTGTDWMNVWESATKVSNPYAYSYENYWQWSAYTPGGESNLSRVWFADEYARTFPTEDRARIMEYLFNSEETVAFCFEYPHICEKAKLYCEILSTCFPSCQKETPFWRAVLESILSTEKKNCIAPETFHLAA